MSYHSFSTNAPWSRASMKGERGMLPDELLTQDGDSGSATPPASARRRGAHEGSGRRFSPTSSGSASPHLQSRFPALHPDTPQSLVRELRSELQQLRSMKDSRDNSAMLALPNTWAAGRAGFSPGLSAPSRKALDAAASALAGAESRALEVMHKAAATHAMDPQLMREAVGTLRGIASHRAEAMQAILQQQASAALLPGIEGIGREGDIDEDRPPWAFGMDDVGFQDEWVAQQLEAQREEQRARAIEAIRAEIKEASILLRKQLHIRQQTEEQREMDVLRGQAEALLNAVRYRHVPPKRRAVAEREVPQRAMDVLEERLAAGLDGREMEDQEDGEGDEGQGTNAEEEEQQPTHPASPQQAPAPSKQPATPPPQQREPAPQKQPAAPPAPPPARAQARPAAAPAQPAHEAEESEREEEEEAPSPQVLTAEQVAQVGQAVQQQMQQLKAAGQMPPELQQIEARMAQIQAQAAQMSPEQQQEAMAIYQQLQAQYQQTGLQWQELLTEQLRQRMFPPPPPPKREKMQTPAAPAKAKPGASASRPALPPAPRPDKAAPKPKPAKQVASKPKALAPQSSSSPRAAPEQKVKKKHEPPEPALEWTKAASESAALAPVPEDEQYEAPAAVQPAEPAQCVELDKLAVRLGGAYTIGQSWHLMLLELVQDHPVPMVCALMDEPGLPLRWVNRAFERLTLWSNDECVGRNCRFLQGKKTEKPAVRMMVKSLREGVPMQPIMLTNYKKDGTEFANVLSLHPVHDSNGRYVYSLGVMIPAEALKDEDGMAAAQLREALPTTFDASLHLEVPLAETSVEEGAADALQWLALMTFFSRRLLLLDAGATLDCLLDHTLSTGNPVAIDMLKSYILQEVDSVRGESGHTLNLETVLAFAKLKLGKGTKVAEKQAREFYARMYGETVKDPLVLGKKLKRLAETARESLCDGPVRGFVKDKTYCKPLLRAMLGEGSSGFAVDRDAWASAARELIWSDYKVPSDLSGFLFSFVSIADSFPTCIVISDMCLAGNPMIFVNREFCRTTGYSKQDVTGLNCRFLQGPKTEPASIAMIQDTLRRGVDCFVRITNYRKNGESFENLLSMRPVHDSNGVYRFCIGVQFDATVAPHNRMGKLKKLLPLLPNELPVNAPPVGARHVKQFKESDNTEAADSDALSEAMDVALAKRGAMASVQKSKAEGANAEYADNFDEMKRRLMRKKHSKEKVKG